MKEGRKQMRKILLITACSIFLTIPARVSTAALHAVAGQQPCSVQRIYVADLGNDPRHLNFRLFLEKWLAKKKFTIAARPEDADAVLTGALSISSGNKYSKLAFKDAELKSASGKTAWQGNFDITTKNAFGWLGRGHIENGAKRIAENIRAACK
jgi:hypothetical protein